MELWLMTNCSSTIRLVTVFPSERTRRVENTGVLVSASWIAQPASSTSVPSMTTYVIPSSKHSFDNCSPKKSCSLRYSMQPFIVLSPPKLTLTQGNTSVATTQLLRVILPGTCLWTSLRDVEGFGYAKTLSELKSQDATATIRMFTARG